MIKLPKLGSKEPNEGSNMRTNIFQDTFLLDRKMQSSQNANSSYNENLTNSMQNSQIFRKQNQLKQSRFITTSFEEEQESEDLGSMKKSWIIEKMDEKSDQITNSYKRDPTKLKNQYDSKDIDEVIQLQARRKRLQADGRRNVNLSCLLPSHQQQQNRFPSEEDSSDSMMSSSNYTPAYSVLSSPALTPLNTSNLSNNSISSSRKRNIKKKNVADLLGFSGSEIPQSGSSSGNSPEYSSREFIPSSTSVKDLLRNKKEDIHHQDDEILDSSEGEKPKKAQLFQSWRGRSYQVHKLKAQTSISLLNGRDEEDEGQQQIQLQQQPYKSQFFSSQSNQQLLQQPELQEPQEEEDTSYLQQQIFPELPMSSNQSIQQSSLKLPSIAKGILKPINKNSAEICRQQKKCVSFKQPK